VINLFVALHCLIYFHSITCNLNHPDLPMSPHIAGPRKNLGKAGTLPTGKETPPGNQQPRPAVSGGGSVYQGSPGPPHDGGIPGALMTHSIVHENRNPRLHARWPGDEESRESGGPVGTGISRCTMDANPSPFSGMDANAIRGSPSWHGMQVSRSHLQSHMTQTVPIFHSQPQQLYSDAPHLDGATRMVNAQLAMGHEAQAQRPHHEVSRGYNQMLAPPMAPGFSQAGSQYSPVNTSTNQDIWAGSAPYHVPTERPAPTPSVGSKRRAPAEDGDTDSPRQTKRRILNDTPTQSRRAPSLNAPRQLACPFYRLDPIRYANCQLRNKLTTPGYVKQHLLRAHGRPMYCPTCGEIFRADGAQERWESHVNARRCVRREKKCVSDCLSEAQTNALQRVVLGAKLDPVGSYTKIWVAIFPNEAVPPNPYVQPGGLEYVMLVARRGLRHPEARVKRAILDVFTQTGFEKAKPVDQAERVAQAVFHATEQLCQDMAAEAFDGGEPQGAIEKYAISEANNDTGQQISGHAQQEPSLEPEVYPQPYQFHPSATIPPPPVNSATSSHQPLQIEPGVGHSTIPRTMFPTYEGHPPARSREVHVDNTGQGTFPNMDRNLPGNELGQGETVSVQDASPLNFDEILTQY